MTNEVILMCGMPASGKSTIVKEYVAKNYVHLSRDISGGAMEGFHKQLKACLAQHFKLNYILDCTYVTVEMRKIAIDIAKAAGYNIKCIFMNTSFEDCQFNAISRMMDKAGYLIKDNDDYKKINDPNLFPVVVLYKARKEFVKPTIAEGFDSIEEVKFKRRKNPAYTNKAIILDYDGTLRETKPGSAHKFPTKVDEVIVFKDRGEILREYKAKGYLLLGISNQAGIAKKDLTKEQAIECFEFTNKELGVDIDYAFCEHSVPPIICYCRKPGAGLGVEFIETYKLNASECIFVGDMTSDETFAKRCGFQYKDHNEFFKSKELAI